uniref:ATP synthase F0 subunit 8 n=1 Tax=Lycus dentipes TaxID=908259 RepID=E3VT80_9COLE|nr:ATP synthase F0 subunit 8 [Lycus dentipes]
MPQMAPLAWLNLMISFTMIILMMNSMNFFYKNLSLTHKKSKFSMKNNWKKW